MMEQYFIRILKIFVNAEQIQISNIFFLPEIYSMNYFINKRIFKLVLHVIDVVCYFIFLNKNEKNKHLAFFQSINIHYKCNT